MSEVPLHCHRSRIPPHSDTEKTGKQNESGPSCNVGVICVVETGSAVSTPECRDATASLPQLWTWLAVEVASQRKWLAIWLARCSG